MFSALARLAARPRLQVMAVLLAALAVWPFVLSAQERRLRLVSTVWPPFTNIPGQSRIALDLVETALKRLTINAESVFVEEGRLTPLLLGGQFDGSAAIWKDAEREKALLFSQPYLENRLILVARRGTDVSANTLAALKGKTVAIVGGYAYGDAIQAATGPTWVRTNGEEDSVQRLLKGEVDYTLMDELVVQYMVKAYPKETQTRLQLGTMPLLVRPLHFAVRRSLPDSEGIIRRFNEQLRGMIADRSYHKLLHVDWIRADIDGDGQLEFVSRSDQAGPLPPEFAYDLYMVDSATGQKKPTQRFSFGDNIYESWATVPERYKRPPTTQFEQYQSDPVAMFRFTW